jgi:2-phospho-L-lactate/phosphoenolpyruvate guanylyltransferase
MRAIWAIIPIKDLSGAKQRLSGLLSAEERRALGLAMLEDVLSALSRAKGLSGILLVSSDAQACDMAARYGARILADTASPGLNPAVSAAARLLASEGVAAALVLHGDIPLAAPGEIEALLEALDPAPAIAIAPDSAHSGTNAMLLCPPDLIPFRYGVNSFQAHLQEAAKCGITARVLDLPGLAFDVDTQNDLISLAAAAQASRAQHLLRGLRLETRIPANPAQAR